MNVLMLETLTLWSLFLRQVAKREARCLMVQGVMWDFMLDGGKSYDKCLIPDCFVSAIYSIVQLPELSLCPQWFQSSTLQQLDKDGL